jgi:hypothetical protein
MERRIRRRRKSKPDPAVCPWSRSAPSPGPGPSPIPSEPSAGPTAGLIDTHVHLVADSEVGALDRVPGLGDDELDAVITERLRRQLAAGVTTVRDLGDLWYGW